MKCLGVLLCYNDGDLLADSIAYLREQRHDIVLWDHGSTDNTAEVVARMRGELLEASFIPRDFDFYELYPAMSRHLIENYVRQYDWISWPDQDEFLEGPSRSRTYYDSLVEVSDSDCDWIEFNNVTYWFTVADDPSVASAPGRIRHYSLFPDCAPRIRSWRASATNIRIFNHNPPDGRRWPVRFNLRHYPMRSLAQALRRVDQDRADLRRGGSNFHYANMARWKQRLEIAPNNLHFDDLRSELNLEPIFNWRSIYGYPAMSLQSTSSLLLSSAILLPESLQLDSTLKGAVRWPLKPTQSAFIDRIEQTNQACTVIGWAVDPDIRDACGVIAFQDGRFIAGQNGHTMERQDVNAALNLAPGTQVGFTLVLPPQTRLGSLSIIAAGVNSIAEVPKAAAVVYSEADSDRVQPAIPVSGLRVPSKDPLFAFPQGSPFGGIYSFRRDFDPRQSAGVTAQFPEEAATYHRKYTAHDYWRSLLCTALERSQIDIRSIRSVLDTGCGSGNTVFPALSVFPHASIVATDISPQLLTVLRNQLSEKDRNRCVCIAMDASERRFEEGAFDVVIGGAILHHIPDPSNTIAAAVSAVRAGGHIFFFEPFEAGNAVLRLLYTELIERKGELGIPDPVLNMCENMRRDLDLRLGKSIGDPALHHLDDKWFFTRSYFEHQCRKLACSEVIIYALSRDPSPFAEQMKTHLRLCLESGPEIVAEAAWAVVRRYDAMVSASLRDELLLEGAILFRK